MKITSLTFLILTIISVYYISNKDKRTLFLFAVSPIIWFMGPWISSIQLASLFFLWGFFFIKKFEESEKKLHLLYSGILIGLSWAVWNTLLLIVPIFIICFFYNKKFKYSILFVFSLILGLSPLLILDQILYGFCLFSTMKFLFATYTALIYGSIYSGRQLLNFSILRIIIFISMIPIFSYKLFSKSIFRQNKETIVFLTLTFLFLLINPQIRYLLLIYPILIICLSKHLTQRHFKIQFVIFLIMAIIVIGSHFSHQSQFDNLVVKDLNQIAKEYPNETFVVGNAVDYYGYLAFVYWGKEVKEFVSIQDYNLYLENNSLLFEKKVIFTPKIQYRRQVWVSGGLEKSENDNTEYGNIKMGIGLNEPINLENFKLIKKYDVLYLSIKKGGQE